MDKNEKIIIEGFNKMNIPRDFTSTFGRELFISTVVGYSQKLIKNEFVDIATDDLKLAETDFKNDASHFVGSNCENIIYYNMLKSCLLIIYKYAK